MCEFHRSRDAKDTFMVNITLTADPDLIAKAGGALNWATRRFRPVARCVAGDELAGSVQAGQDKAQAQGPSVHRSPSLLAGSRPRQERGGPALQIGMTPKAGVLEHVLPRNDTKNI